MTEKYRPQLHFAPAAGWMNDPNGMVLVDGQYHLFFQHDPDSVQHGPMHWGHAVSTDLAHWTERPVALYPTALGTCFSGSAVRTADGEVKLLYTAHRVDERGRDFQTQCLVHADRTLTSFTQHSGNPVLGNPGLEVFRDPKIVWHKPTGRWIMALTHGQAVGFYASTDLIDWHYLTSFGEGHGRHGTGVWECPDLLPMRTPRGDTLWVLLVSLSEDAYGPGSGTQYFVGRFDGHRFINANPASTELWLDYGRDFYAPQTFFDDSGTGPVAMAWASNWTYARDTPTHAFRGLMSLPRQLRLVETPAGMRVAQSIPATVRAAFDTARAGSGVSHRHVELDLAPGQAANLCLFGEAAPHFRIRRIGATTALIETAREGHTGMAGFAHRYDVPLACAPGAPIRLELFIDRGMVELSAGDGLMLISNLFFPDNPEGEVSIGVTGSSRPDDRQAVPGPVAKFRHPGTAHPNPASEEVHHG